MDPHTADMLHRNDVDVDGALFTLEVTDPHANDIYERAFGAQVVLSGAVRSPVEDCHLKWDGDACGCLTRTRRWCVIPIVGNALERTHLCVRSEAVQTIFQNVILTMHDKVLDRHSGCRHAVPPSPHP